MFGIGIPLSNESKKLCAESKYNEAERRWANYRHSSPICVTCKTRRVWPQATTSALPIRPSWDGSVLECIVCDSEHWNYVGGMDGLFLTRRNH